MNIKLPTESRVVGSQVPRTVFAEADKDSLRSFYIYDILVSFCSPLLSLLDVIKTERRNSKQNLSN